MQTLEIGGSNEDLEKNSFFNSDFIIDNRSTLSWIILMLLELIKDSLRLSDASYSSYLLEKKEEKNEILEKEEEKRKEEVTSQLTVIKVGDGCFSNAHTVILKGNCIFFYS